MNPAMVMTALERALTLGERLLSEARKIERANAAAGVKFLGAAQAAVTGLEEEVDEILVEAKLVARFYWERRPALYERIELYVNRDRLRSVLDRSIQGIERCVAEMQKDEGPFTRRAKTEATAELVALVKRLSGFLFSLGTAMREGKENFTSGSGINMPILLEIQSLISQPDDPAAEPELRRRIVERVAETQRNRERRGLPLVSQAASTIQELTVAFGLALLDDGGKASEKK